MNRKPEIHDYENRMTEFFREKLGADFARTFAAELERSRAPVPLCLSCLARLPDCRCKVAP